MEDHVIDAFLRRVNQQRVQREPPAPAEAASARVHTPECEFPTVPQAERRCVLQAHRHPLGPSRVPHREQQFTPRHPHAHVLAGKHAQTVLPPRYRHDSPLTNRRAGSGGGNFATSRNCRTIHAPRRATRAGISNSGKSGGATTRRRHLDAERPAFAAHQHKRNGGGAVLGGEKKPLCFAALQVTPRPGAAPQTAPSRSERLTSMCRMKA